MDQEIERLRAQVRDLERRLRGRPVGDPFRRVFESAPYGMIVSDERGTILMANPRAEEMFGYEAEEFVGLSIDALVPTRARKGHGAMRENFHADPKPRPMGAGRELHACHRDGSEFPVEIALTPLPGEAGPLVLSSIVDISRRKDAEADATLYAERLERSNAELVRISENEQRRIGQDLHDDLCSQLSGIGCMTKVLESRLREQGAGESELAAEITGMVAQAGAKAREIAKGLVPTVLETQGLAGALREFVAQKRETFGVNCVAVIADDEALNALHGSISIQLFRIAQEAVTNAIRHSDAEMIELSLLRDGKAIEFRVRDDGRGMLRDPRGGGMGLLTMRRRAEMIGAEFAIRASPGAGSEITCRISLPEATRPGLECDE